MIFGKLAKFKIFISRMPLFFLLQIVGLFIFPTCTNNEHDATLDPVVVLEDTNFRHCTPSKCFGLDFFKKFHPNYIQDGPWRLNPDVVKKTYKGLNAAEFGDLNLQFAHDLSMNPPSKKIHEFQYELERGIFGIRPIPVIDRRGSPSYAKNAFNSINNILNNYPTIGTTSDGIKIRGTEILDNLIINKQMLAEENGVAPIFAITTYMRPEYFTGSLHDFASIDKLMRGQLKMVQSMPHSGIYTGYGQTRNLPLDYPSEGVRMRLNVKGYPAHITTISLQNVKQQTFNKNAISITRLLGELDGGPVFAKTPADDQYRTVTLADLLHFYAATLWKDYRRSETEAPFYNIIRNDPTWAVYCSEFVEMAVNLSLNVVQNQEWYRQIWKRDTFANELGQVTTKRNVGDILWQQAQKKHFELSGGKAMPVIKTDEFTPLWKQLNITNPLTEFQVGKSLAWRPFTNIDWLIQFLHNYAAWVDVGPTKSTAILAALSEELQRRTNIQPREYYKIGLPLSAKMYFFHAISTQFFDETKIKNTDIDALLDQYIEDQGKEIDYEFREYADYAKIIKTNFAEFLRSNRFQLQEIARQKNTLSQLYLRYLISIEREVNKLRELEQSHLEAASNSNKIKYYAPPFIAHSVANGSHPSEKLVKLKTIATAFDASEIQKSP